MESVPETARPLTPSAPALARKRRRQEKGWEDSLLASSSSMWERSHRLLWMTVLGSTFLDFSSTFYALGLSGRPLVEGNILARFALDKGGFGGLAVWDLTKVAFYAVLALAVLRVSNRLGRPELGKFVTLTLLVYYLIFRLVATANNLFLSLS